MDMGISERENTINSLKYNSYWHGFTISTEYSTFYLTGNRPALTLRSIGGIIDLHFFLGPTLEDVNRQYTQVGTQGWNWA